MRARGLSLFFFFFFFFKVVISFPREQTNVRREDVCITLSLFSSAGSHKRRAPLEKKKKIKQTLFIPLSLTLFVSLVVVCLSVSASARTEEECGVSF
jgi:hypothetical protein